MRVERSSSGQKNKHTTETNETNETVASSYARAPVETSVLPCMVHKTLFGCKVISFSFLTDFLTDQR